MQIGPTAQNPSLTRWDNVALGIALLSLLAIATLNLGTSTTYKPFAPPHRPWCRVGELPSFHFGFAELAAAIGSDAGQPIECEHGVEHTPDTTQATTTGVLTYSWCTNTPIFTRADEHWMLTDKGLVHWADDDVPPRPPPVMRDRDLRQPCTT